MNTSVRDPSLLAKLSPGSVTAYLHANEWRQVDRIEGKATVWESPGPPPCAEVIAPIRTDVGDYLARMADLVTQVAEHEGRPGYQVFRDLCESSSDIVRVRVRSEVGAPTSLPLHQGVDLVTGAREMLMSAACATLERKRAYPTRRPPEAVAYMDTVQLGQTEVGSFVLALLSPVSPALGGQTELDIDAPYPRRVVETLARALEATREAAVSASTLEDISAFESSVHFGVSADLCGALARMAGLEPRTQALEVSVGWSPRRAPSRPWRPVIRFAPDLVPVIAEAGRVFRETSPEDDCEVIGIVTALKREEDASPGAVTVKGFVEGELRKVALVLADDDYQAAIRAHKDYITVACRGDLARKGNRFELRNPRSFRHLVDP